VRWLTFRSQVPASSGQRLAPLLQRFGGARYLRALSAFFPAYDALARTPGTDTTVRRFYDAGHTLDARAVDDRERWLGGCLAS
jgi:hypothetical protein